jgi:hypothetical protein
MPSTTFDEVLGLEEQFYDDGYRQGLADGVKAGRIEGRTFGLEKGFEKYIESGRLHGKSIIWANRMVQNVKGEASINPTSNVTVSGPKILDTPTSQRLEMPQLPNNARLAKNVRVLYALAESDSLSTENSEEAVSDFDDRFKRAQAKAKIIERMAGEVKNDTKELTNPTSSKDGSIEDVSVLNARH